MSSAERPRVFVSRVITDDALERVRSATDVDLWPDPDPPPRAELLRHVRGVRGFLSMVSDKVDDELLDAAGPDLRVVSNFGVGYDHIDVAACSRHGVAVGNTPGVLTETTADHSFALLMAAARRLPEGYDYVRAGRWGAWQPMLLVGADVHHTRLGIIGFGRIGREVARRGRGFDMDVVFHNRHTVSETHGARQVSLDELLATSDFVSLHVSLNPESRQLINRESLSKMKRSAILVNTSRGLVVNSDDLYDALRDGVIAGAALDVTDPEPLPADHKLLSLPNCLVVPHLASASMATRRAMSRIAVDNLLAGIEERPLPSCVNPDVYGVRA